MSNILILFKTFFVIFWTICFVIVYAFEYGGPFIIIHNHYHDIWNKSKWWCFVF